MSIKKEDKREALLKAALELFAEQGFNGSSTASIAKRAAVASGTLFLYFKSKEELIHQLFREVSCRIEQKVVLSPDTESLPLPDRLLRMLTNLLHYFLEHPDEFKFVEQYHFSPLRDTAFEQQIKEYTIIRLLRQGQEQGLIKPVPLLVLEALAFGPITALAKERAMRNVTIDEQICRSTIAACWDAIRLPNHHP